MLILNRITNKVLHDVPDASTTGEAVRPSACTMIASTSGPKSTISTWR